MPCGSITIKHQTFYRLVYRYRLFTKRLLPSGLRVQHVGASASLPIAAHSRTRGGLTDVVLVTIGYIYHIRKTGKR